MGLGNVGQGRVSLERHQTRHAHAVLNYHPRPPVVRTYYSSTTKVRTAVVSVDKRILPRSSLGHIASSTLNTILIHSLLLNPQCFSPVPPVACARTTPAWGQRQIGPREFHAGNRVALAPYRRGISDGTQFLDPWRNPYMVRGVPREQAELNRPLNEVRLRHPHLA